MEKILIVVDGGVVQDVVSTTSNIQVLLVDYDNFSENNSSEEMYEQLEMGFDFGYIIQPPNKFDKTIKAIKKNLKIEAKAAEKSEKEAE